jgi:uncharacterized membrane protein
MILTLLLVILTYRLIVNSNSEENVNMAIDTPIAIDIIDERYARGEIDRATYLAMRAEIV